VAGENADFNIPGVDVAEEIYRSDRTVVMRGRRRPSGTPVIIKTLSEEDHDPRDVVRLCHEHEILQALGAPGIVRSLGLERLNGSFALLLEDFGGISLDRHLATHRFDIPSFLSMASQLTDALGAIHNRGIIHKDLNPSNILINVATDEVKISDFGIASFLEREAQNDTDVHLLEGTLPYISPEQTGRMNRSIDYRTDFYSLGATLYEVLLGWPPFQSGDPMELVHSHIARRPIPPRELNREIPASVSAIVMKLLSKTAEERYRTARGLKADWDRCAVELKSDGAVSVFEPGAEDFSDRFAIDQRLYGREEETRLLLDAFDRVCEGSPESLFVCGLPGIGKSALLHEVYKPLTNRRGFFLSGKYDEFQRNVPYASFLTAFRDLVRQILAGTDEQLVEWKTKLLEPLGKNGRVMVDLLPELELIIGPQPPVQGLPSTEAQNRIHSVLCAFVRAVARKEHPLVLFLDDLQWADPASLDLMRLLMGESRDMHLLFLGAFRFPEDVDGLDRAIVEMERSGCSIHRVVLLPLDADTTNRLIADSLHCSPAESAPLSALVHEKTDGNPFFVNEFLKSLYREKLLWFDPAGHDWKWDPGRILQKDITDNVVTMMTAKIRYLPGEGQRALMTASCIGSTFELSPLAMALGLPEVRTAEQLWGAISEGLILPVGDAYKFVGGFGSDRATYMLPAHYSGVAYRFTHDRVQQAAYSLIPDGGKAALHFAIGSNLLKSAGEPENDRRILDIVNHMNLGAASLAGREEKRTLAALNLVAGRRAKGSGAFEAALRFFMAGKALLATHDWETHYRLVYDLTTELGECEYLTGKFPEAGERFAECHDHARGAMDRARICHHQVALYVYAGNPDRGITAGIKGLGLIGVRIAPAPGKMAVLASLLRVKWLLRGRRILELGHLPPMTDEKQRLALRILMAMVHFAYRSSENLSAVVILKMVDATLTHGTAEESPYAFATYGLVLSTGFGAVDSGCAFGDLAVRVAARNANPYMLGRCLFVLGSVLHGWRHDLPEGMKILADAHRQSLSSGDLEYASYALIHLTLDAIVTGEALDEVYRKAAENLEFVRRFKFANPELTFVLARQMVLSLKGATSGEGSLDDGEWKEEDYLALLGRSNENVARMYHTVFRMQVHYLFGQFDDALRTARDSKPFTAALRGQILKVEYCFYESLTLCQVMPRFPPRERRKAGRALRHNLRKMKRWANGAPGNFQHKYLLAQAEAARCTGRTEEAMRLYDRAIASAAEHHFIQNAALAGELAARFHLAAQRTSVARAYMLDARAGYADWGATGKVAALDRQYPALISGGVRRPRTESGKTGSRVGETVSGTLDLTSVLKASQALSSEIDLDRLMEKMMLIVLENAGAERGVLIMEEGNQLLVRAEGGTDGAVMVQSVPLGEYGRLSEAAVHYVARTGEGVLLNDATRESILKSDPYVTSGRPKSLLCLPITNQGKRSGILYLENNLTTDAFTPRRLEVLKLLSSQIAISLENARLHGKEKAYARVQEEIRLAARIQIELLPRSSPALPGYEIAGINHPAQVIGGDYYDFIPLGDHRLAICLGDVAGKGLPASLLMANLQATLRGQTLFDATAAECIRRSNKLLWESTGAEKFATVFFGILDRENHRFSYVNAGHEIPFILTGGPEPVRLDKGGVALGVVEEFDFKEGSVTLGPGDTMVIVSDGITESMNSSQEQFGEERLWHLLFGLRGCHAQAVIERVIEAVRSFVGEAPQWDDMTVVVVRRAPES
jgi:predicted ATPase/serine phosphatase RsbU (regulator of sigma subunit)/tRNA A-37 threonylcarbamoyl transferase component Bud32